MNPHIEYLKQLKAHGQTVVGIDYVLQAFGSNTAKVPDRLFGKQQEEWRTREALAGKRMY